MKRILYYLIIIAVLLCSHIIYARDVTTVNWPSSRSMEPTCSTEGEEIKVCAEEPECFDLLVPAPASPQTHAGITGNAASRDNFLSERIIVELRNDVTKENLTVLKNMGCKIEVYVFNLVQVSISPELIEDIRKLNFVKYLRYPTEVKGNSGIINGPLFFDEEDFSGINLKEAHKSGYLGEGVKVAIIDTAFDPDHPLFKKNILYTQSFRSEDKNIKNGDIKHGNAVAEIVNIVAPKSKLILINFKTDVEYIKALTELINKDESFKPDIILTTVNLILPDDYYDGTGAVAGLAYLARVKGITLISSAGNNGQTHYKGTFSDSNGNQLHNFTTGDDTLEIELKKDDKLRVVMAWKDNWNSPAQDLDLGIFNDSLDPLKISNINQIDISAPPYEILEITAPYSGPYHIAVRKGADAYEGLPFMIYVYSISARNMEYYNPETSLDPGLPTAHDGITVGAVQNQFPYQSEPWSSQGKTTDNRLKPDIVALSGIYCTSNQGMFWGTSSAAPQVAGTVALLLSKNSYLTPDEIKNILKKTAKDLGTPGEDPVFGAGLINIYKAINSI